MNDENNIPQELFEQHHQAADSLVKLMISALDTQAPEIAKNAAVLMDRGARLQLVHDMAGSSVLMLVADEKALPLMSIDAERRLRVLN